MVGVSLFYDECFGLTQNFVGNPNHRPANQPTTVGGLTGGG
jgi:hypothetical protein